MRQVASRPENTEFVILSFEGPDRYAMAGGLGMRVDHLSQTLAGMGFTTHLFFIGDPDLLGEEVRQEGKLILHRWCQWISRYYPEGVYAGEDAKLYDFTGSIPEFVKDHIVKPAVAQGKLVVVLGEEWQTAEPMCRLSDPLDDDSLKDHVVLFWNANNTYSFHRIDWPRLNSRTTITTVSRYMKHLMWRMGLNPLVIPNGIPKHLTRNGDGQVARRVRKTLGADVVLFKMARWNPDKNWEEAIRATAALKERGLKTVLVARGGLELYGHEVMRSARSLGLKVSEASLPASASGDYLAALETAAGADVIDVRFHVPLAVSGVLYAAAEAVLANSGHEPFGLVALEAMAAGGIAFTGSTGEDYAIHFVNSIVLQTGDPKEIEGYVTYLRDHPDEGSRIRHGARRTAGFYTWEAAARNLISKLGIQARLQGTLD